MPTIAGSFSGSGELNSGLGVCKVYTLPVEPFPLTPLQSFLWSGRDERRGKPLVGLSAVVTDTEPSVKVTGMEVGMQRGFRLHSPPHVGTEAWPACARASLKGGPERYSYRPHTPLRGDLQPHPPQAYKGVPKDMSGTLGQLWSFRHIREAEFVPLPAAVIANEGIVRLLDVDVISHTEHITGCLWPTES